MHEADVERHFELEVRPIAQDARTLLALGMASAYCGRSS